jgi:hypothetical protein
MTSGRRGSTAAGRGEQGSIGWLKPGSRKLAAQRGELVA